MRLNIEHPHLAEAEDVDDVVAVEGGVGGPVVHEILVSVVQHLGGEEAECGGGGV